MSAVHSVVALQSVPIDSARLPVRYESAVLALSECSRIDECQDWADKAQALASYARQAKDDQMRKMAERIQARAINRCGELLKQIPDNNRGRPAKDIPDGSVTNITRAEAAEQAGMSERQRVTALRVASIPRAEFERLVESDAPPTVTKLAEIGKQERPKPLVDLGGIDPADFARATAAQGALRRFSEYCGANDPVRIARAFQAHEVAEMRRFVSTVDAWLDRFVTNLQG